MFEPNANKSSNQKLRSRMQTARSEAVEKEKTFGKGSNGVITDNVTHQRRVRAAYFSTGKSPQGNAMR